MSLQEGWNAFQARKQKEGEYTPDDNALESRNLTTEERALFEAARQACGTLKRTFDVWMVIALGVECARKRADKIGGKKTKETFLRILEQQGLSGVLGETPSSVRTTAVRLLKILENELEVQAWRRELTSWERFQWSSPTAVYKWCPVFHQKDERAGGPEKKEEEKPKSAAQRIKELEAALAHAEEKLAVYDAPARPEPMWQEAAPPRTYQALLNHWKPIREALLSGDISIDDLDEFWRVVEYARGEVSERFTKPVEKSVEAAEEPAAGGTRNPASGSPCGAGYAFQRGGGTRGSTGTRPGPQEEEEGNDQGQ